jgi:uncharacterized protein YggE
MKLLNAFGIFLLAACGGNSGVSGAPELPKIYATGTAEKKVEPNLARIVFAVLTRAPTAEKARGENAVKTSALAAKLKDLKIPEEDMQTMDYRIQEVTGYKNGTSTIEGYEVVSRMQLRILDVKSLGKIIDQLVPLGANKIENVEFDIAERDEVYRELLEEATTLAKEKANRMAEAAGLGKISVLEVREEPGYTAQPVYHFEMAKVAGDAPTQIAPSAKIKASVTLTAKAKD